MHIFAEFLLQSFSHRLKPLKLLLNPVEAAFQTFAQKHSKQSIHDKSCERNGKKRRKNINNYENAS